MKRVAIIQSNYIPWKGYFDIINSVDEFILYDDRQFTRRDWRNRNLIKTSEGLRWLTIPVQVKGKFEQAIEETMIDDSSWAEKHWKTIAQTYARAPHFRAFEASVEKLYAGADSKRLSDVNRRFIEGICQVLGIETEIKWSSDYGASGDRTARLVDLCEKAGAREYLSGPAARAYIENDLFVAGGIDLIYMDYSGYPEYPQLYGKFEHGVSVLDLIFNAGADAPRFMKSFDVSAN
ncbi:MAG TPA: WbqC family protein [Candidatus Dormibacteraeota bacterium]|nr:WbqC family protein [Candidatus Dormibacteraeota bacterium]